MTKINIFVIISAEVQEKNSLIVFRRPLKIDFGNRDFEVTKFEIYCARIFFSISNHLKITQHQPSWCWKVCFWRCCSLCEMCNIKRVNLLDFCSYISSITLTDLPLTVKTSWVAKHFFASRSASALFTLMT